jgi:WD40 repeat protein
MWNLYTGGMVIQANDVPRRLDGKPDVNVNSPVLAFSPDDSQVAVRVGSVLQVWNTESGRLKTSLTGHKGVISSIAFNPDNKTVATGTGVDEQTIRIWDLATGALSFKIDGYVSDRLEYDASGKYLYIVGSDTLRIYRNGEAEAFRTLRGVGSIVKISPTNTSVAYTICTNGSGKACRQHIAQIYFPETEAILRLIGTTSTIHDLDFSPDGNLLTAATGSGYLSWKISDSSVYTTVRLEDSNQQITWLDYSPDGQMILGNESGKRLHFWDVLTNTLIQSLDIQAGWVTWSPDGRFFAVVNDTGIDVWGVNP